MSAIVVDRLEAHLDISELLNSVIPLFDKYPPQYRSPAFGGWSLQSNTGSYSQGWTQDFVPYNGPNNLGPSWSPKSKLESGLHTVQNSMVPTEMMTEPFQKLIDKLEALHLNPRRARIVRIMPGNSTVWHIDGSSRFYQVRLCIPLLTNPHCFFENEQGRYHMKADGALYFTHINKMHRAANFGETERFQFICHVWDQDHITQFHRYDPAENPGESHHLDEVDLNSQYKRN